jgi:hypothetical protein
MTKLDPAILQRMIVSLRDELAKIEGVALCLIGLTEEPWPGDADAPFRYLGGQLKKHSAIAFNALDEIAQGMGGVE